MMERRRFPYSSFAQASSANPPVWRASTVLFETLEAFEASAAARFDTFFYGRLNTPTQMAFEEEITAMEGAYRTVAVASGQAAIIAALTALLAPGSHLLMVDTAYGPTRHVCDTLLRKFGIATTYYVPGIGAEIRDLIQPSTRAIYLESPGSLTFEVQDVAAIASVAHEHDCAVVMDNSWATPLLFKPMAHGVDVSLMSASKYIAGHSDCLIGTLATTERYWPAIRQASADLGVCVSPDVCYLAHRGLRTLAARLERQGTSALWLAQQLERHPRVAGVLHPALPSFPGHHLFERDFKRASGLFAIMLPEISHAAFAEFIDGLRLFRLGVSWGGFESIIYPANPAKLRTACAWKHPGPVLRISTGLENPEELLADLVRGLDALPPS